MHSGPVHESHAMLRYKLEWNTMKRLAVLVFGPSLLMAAPAFAQSPFPPGEGQKVVADACTQCHAAELVTNTGKTREGWADTVTTMIGNGAAVTDADFNKVVDYLAKNYPVK